MIIAVISEHPDMVALTPGAVLNGNVAHIHTCEDAVGKNLVAVVYDDGSSREMTEAVNRRIQSRLDVQAYLSNEAAV